MYEKKIGYLKGLLAGLKLDPDSDQTKVFYAIADALEAIGDAVADVKDELEDLSEDVEELEEEIEEYSEVFNVLEEAVEDSGKLRRFPGFFDVDDDDEDEEEDEDDVAEYEIRCPACEKEFIIDEETILSGSVDCPGCHQSMAFDLNMEHACGCDHKEHNDCGCSHCHEPEDQEDE